MARGPHTPASSHTKGSASLPNPESLGKEGKATRRGQLPRGMASIRRRGVLGGAPGRALAGNVQARSPWNTLRSGDWRGPRVVLPACQPPFAAQTLAPTPPPSNASPACAPLAPVRVWPFSGLRIPPPRGGRQRETHSSLCHFPSWAAKGLRLQPPAPSLQLACVYSHFLRPGPPLLENLHPPAPLMLCRWEQGGCWPQRFPALDFLQPGQAGLLKGALPPRVGTPSRWPPT